MGQKWRKIRRRCSSFNTGAGKGNKGANDHRPCDYGGGQDCGPLIPTSSSDDSTVSLSSPPSSSTAAVSTAANAVHDMLRARLNILNIGNNKRRLPQLHDQHHRSTVAAADTSTFYVPSPLLRTDGHRYDDDNSAGPCSLPVAFDLCSDHQMLRASSRCSRAIETPSSCGSSGRGTADDGAGSDRSSVSFSDHGYNSIASCTVTAIGHDVDR